MNKKHVLINIIITIIFAISVLIIQLQSDNMFDIGLTAVTYIGVTINLYCIISSIIIYKRITLPSIIFQIFSLVFLYGLLICEQILHYKPSDMFDLSILVTEKSEITACFLIMYSELFLHLGTLIQIIKKKKYVEQTEETFEKKKIDLLVIKKIGLILVCISIVPAFINFYKNLTAAAEYGYSGLGQIATYGLSSIITKIVPFFQIGMYCLMVAYRDKIKISRGILAFCIVFYGTQILFGNRGIPLIAVVTTIWLYHIAVKKISKKTIVICSILIIPLSMFINIIRVVRVEYGISEWIKNIPQLIEKTTKEDNPIVESIYEMGGAIYPTAYTINAIPEKTDYKYGSNYMLSLYSVIHINVSNSKSEFANKINIAAEISEMAGAPFGGSYIQEAYANFGWFSIFFFLILGMLFEKLNRKVIENKKIINLVLIAYFLNPLLWTVRNVMITLPRELCWYMLPVFVLYKILLNTEKRKVQVNIK